MDLHLWADVGVSPDCLSLFVCTAARRLLQQTSHLHTVTFCIKLAACKPHISVLNTAGCKHLLSTCIGCCGSEERSMTVGKFKNVKNVDMHCHAYHSGDLRAVSHERDHAP